jgi:adenosylcobinamide kinase/adenosylcobinamide-phosphate guanylyltransferase
MPKELVFILGGARSGKSSFAERLAAQSERVLFVATAEAHDDDMKQRIAAHRNARPENWDTLEEPVELSSSLSTSAKGYDTVLIDCLTLWVSNLLLKDESAPGVQSEILRRTHELLEVYEKQDATWILVSNEVGLGIVPPSRLGRVYRDLLGRVNQVAACRADKVYLMVVGLALELKSLGAQPFSQASLEHQSKCE